MVTIWIHGTRLFKTVTQPLDEYIHAAPPTGLTPITKLSHKHRLIRVAKTLSNADPHRFSLDTFYAFGWSGDLSFAARKEAASKLYQELLHLREELTKGWFFWQKKPKFRLITHSHGSNVVLNLAQVKKSNDDLIIDEAIFLAGPVQKETRDFVHAPCFKKIYAFYSTLDSIQILDPQGMYKLKDGDKRHVQFSGRRLPFSPKVYQTKIKINGHGVPHVGFIMNKFVQLLPTALDEVSEWYKQEPIKECQERLLSIRT